MNNYIKQVLVALVLILAFTIASYLPLLVVVVVSILFALVADVNIKFSTDKFKELITKYFK